MRNPDKQAGPASLRAARPTPNYNDEVSDGFLERQAAYINSKHPNGLEFTPVSEDAW